MFGKGALIVRMVSWAIVTFVVTLGVLMQLGTSWHGSYEYYGKYPLTYPGPTAAAFLAPLILAWTKKS